MSAAAQFQTESPDFDDLAQSLLNAYGGDAIAALRVVIEDAAFLHDELYTASRLISRGVARGWKPRFQREA